MEHYILIAADAVSSLRECDIFRVLESAPADKRAELARYIVKCRPEFGKEVGECLEDLTATM